MRYALQVIFVVHQIVLNLVSLVALIHTQMRSAQPIASYVQLGKYLVPPHRHVIPALQGTLFHREIVIHVSQEHIHFLERRHARIVLQVVGLPQLHQFAPYALQEHFLQGNYVCLANLDCTLLQERRRALPAPVGNGLPRLQVNA